MTTKLLLIKDKRILATIVINARDLEVDVIDDSCETATEQCMVGLDTLSEQDVPVPKVL